MMKRPAARPLAAVHSAVLALSLVAAQADAQGVGAAAEGGGSSQPSVMLPGTAAPEFYMMEWGEAVAVSPDISIAQHRVEAGDTVWEVLRENGFQPNADLLGVVRALNPDRPDLNRLSPGDVLELPLVDDAAYSTNRVVMVDDAVRRDFDVTLANFAALKAPGLARLAEEDVRNQLDRVNAALEVIDDARATLPGDVLQAAQDRATFIRDALAPRFALAGGGMADGGYASLLKGNPLGSNPSWIQEALSGLEELAGRVRTNQKIHDDLVVHTLSSSTNKPVCGIAVYYFQSFYSMIGRKDPPTRRLHIFSSPATGKAVVAELHVWAEWKEKVVSNVEVFDLTTGKAEYQLHVREGAECP